MVRNSYPEPFKFNNKQSVMYVLMQIIYCKYVINPSKCNKCFINANKILMRLSELLQNNILFIQVLLGYHCGSLGYQQCSLGYTKLIKGFSGAHWVFIKVHSDTSGFISVLLGIIWVPDVSIGVLKAHWGIIKVHMGYHLGLFGYTKLIMVLFWIIGVIIYVYYMAYVSFIPPCKQNSPYSLTCLHQTVKNTRFNIITLNILLTNLFRLCTR